MTSPDMPDSQQCPAGTEGCPCTPTEGCIDRLYCTNGICGEAPSCGNGIVEPPEACDDGNSIAYDGCESNCTRSRGIVQLAAGAAHTCAVLWNGHVRCWGRGTEGQLGYGSRRFIGDDETPAWQGDVPLPASALQIAAGDYHTCALLEDRSVHCWGSDEFGQLGRGRRPEDCSVDGFDCRADARCCIGDDEPADVGVPVDIDGVPDHLVAGGFSTCAVLESGALQCWGANQFGQLGLGLGSCPGTRCDAGPWCCIGDDDPPLTVPGLELEHLRGLTLSATSTCMLERDGQLRCWGLPVERPDALASTCGGQIFDSFFHSCAADPECCLGDDEAASELAPVEHEQAISMVALDAGFDGKSEPMVRRCLSDSFSVHCEDSNGATATLLSGSLREIVETFEISLVPPRACTRAIDGTVRCWGENQLGTLGYGHTEPVEGPGAAGGVVLGGTAVQLVSGRKHTCAKLTDRTVRCWGPDGLAGYGMGEPIGDDETPAQAGEVPIE